jgi:hypothetical protein
MVAVMHGVLTNAETVLAQNGRHGDVGEFRERCRQVMEADFRAGLSG